MSGSPAAGGDRPRRPPRFPAHRAACSIVHWLWHPAYMLAISGLVGCFYVKPILPPAANMPPAILNPSENPASVNVSTGSVTLQVNAEDAEGDNIRFAWFGLENVNVINDDVIPSGGLWTSRVTIVDVDQLRLRPTVRVLVYNDLSLNDGVEVRFNLVFP